MAVTKEQLDAVRQTLKPMYGDNPSTPAEYQAYKDLQDQYFADQTAATNAATALASAATAALPQSTIKSPDQTNPSATDAASAEKMAQGNQPGDGASLISGRAAKDDIVVTQSPPTRGFAKDDRVSAITASAPTTTKTVTPSWGNNDHRVRLRVPSSYLIGPAAGPNSELKNNGGIIFPYTPTIGQEYRAEYASQNVIHSNYVPKFYKNSSVSDITLTAKFTVQNETDACILLATVHLLRALTKMKFGDDDNSGSPPPVCRLMALGDFGFDNAPVAIGSVKLDYLDTVDYIETGNTIKSYGRSFVPVYSTISLSLIPIYSRNEMQKFTVKDWLNADSSRLKGYL